MKHMLKSPFPKSAIIHWLVDMAFINCVKVVGIYIRKMFILRIDVFLLKRHIKINGAINLKDYDERTRYIFGK